MVHSRRHSHSGINVIAEPVRGAGRRVSPSPLAWRRPAKSGRQRGKVELTGAERKYGTGKKKGTRGREQHSRSHEPQRGRQPWCPGDSTPWKARRGSKAGWPVTSSAGAPPPPPGSTSDFSPFSDRTSLLHCHLCLRLWHSDSGTPSLFPSDILSGIRGVAELRSSNTAILAGNSYASFHLPDSAKQRGVSSLMQHIIHTCFMALTHCCNCLTIFPTWLWVPRSFILLFVFGA